MPRLPFPHYLHHHLALRAEWLRGAYAFTLLTPTEQIALHNFYEPSLELSEEQLGEHRRHVTREQRGLPHRAGKAYARIAPFIGEPVLLVPITSVVVAGKRKGEYRRIGVTSVVQAHIDPAEIAQILINAAREQARQERLEREQNQHEAKEKERDQDQAA